MFKKKKFIIKKNSYFKKLELETDITLKSEAYILK